MQHNSPDIPYPFSFAEIEAYVAQCGPQLVDEFERLKTSTTDGPWRTETIGGFGTVHCKDIRVARVDNTPFSVVYWGGDAAEKTCLWSFHISRYRERPNATQFDPAQDTPLVLAKEKLRVLVDTHKGRLPLQDGLLLANEGTIVYLEYSPRNAPQQVIPITFPTRGPPRRVGGVILT